VIGGARAYSGYSNLASARTTGTTAATRFSNDSSYPVVSLVVDGVEQFPSAPLGIAVNNYLELALAPGSHSYRAITGFWNGSARQTMYQTTGTVTQGAGTTTVSIPNPAIGALLTHLAGGSNVGMWTGSVWDGLVPHTQSFCFTGAGAWRYYVDGAYITQGQVQLVSYPRPGTFQVTFQVSAAAGNQGTYDETTGGSFYMRNGPVGFEWVEYDYQGFRASCP